MYLELFLVLVLLIILYKGYDLYVGEVTPAVTTVKYNPTINEGKLDPVTNTIVYKKPVYRTLYMRKGGDNHYLSTEFKDPDDLDGSLVTGQFKVLATQQEGTVPYCVGTDFHWDDGKVSKSIIQKGGTCMDGYDRLFTFYANDGVPTYPSTPVCVTQKNGGYDFTVGESTCGGNRFNAVLG